jgi:DNA-binding transcriptional regulator YiaG
LATPEAAPGNTTVPALGIKQLFKQAADRDHIEIEAHRRRRCVRFRAKLTAAGFASQAEFARYLRVDIGTVSRWAASRSLTRSSRRHGNPRFKAASPK